jgi:hypothetical protein
MQEYIIFSPYSPAYTLSLYPPPSQWCQSPREDPFYLPVLHFWERKKDIFLFKISTQRVSLWHFHVNMYYNPNWFIPSILLLSTLDLSLWWFNSFKFLYSFLYKTHPPWPPSWLLSFISLNSFPISESLPTFKFSLQCTYLAKWCQVCNP